MNRIRARELARSYLSQGEPTGWFDVLYVESRNDAMGIPWADLAPNPNFLEWFEANTIEPKGREAIVVGCGLGDDAEFLSDAGFKLTAFDIAPEAVRWCQRRFPSSRVSYRTADLFKLPAGWRCRFDLIVEIYTLQVLPPTIRPQAMQAIVDLVASQGQLLLMTRGREEDEAEGEMPWPLTKKELSQFIRRNLEQETFDDYWDQEVPPVHRFRVAYRKSKGGIPRRSPRSVSVGPSEGPTKERRT